MEDSWLYLLRCQWITRLSAVNMQRHVERSLVFLLVTIKTTSLEFRWRVGANSGLIKPTLRTTQS